jgi:multiple sugar transport system permease protein
MKGEQTNFKRNMSALKRAKSVGYYILVYGIMICVIFPFLWMVLSSFKTQVEMMDAKKFFTFIPTLQNYRDVFERYNFSAPIINSLIIAAVSTTLALMLGVPASYAIARYRMTKLSIVLLIVRMIPAITFLVPWYIIFSMLGIIDTYLSMILAHMLVALPFIVWIMVPYFETIPREIEESAFVDGSGKFRTFFQIVLPLCGPGTVTAAILSFVFSWNNFMFGIILSGRKTKTLPIAIYGFLSYTDTNWGGLMAGSVIITAPIIVLSLFLQKYIIQGLTAGAVKG